MARATAIPIWDQGRYILGENGEKIGLIDVSGLDGVFSAINSRADELNRFPGLRIVPMDNETKAWVRDWIKTNGDRRDFVIRDNPRKRWFHLRDALITGPSGYESISVAIESASLGDDPFMR